MDLHEGSSAIARYDAVAELIHGEGARFPEDQQKQVEETADRMKSLIEGAGQRSSVLGAFVSVLIPSSLALLGQRKEIAVAVVPDHLSPSVHKDSRLLLAAFHARPFDLELHMTPEDYLFQAARQFTQAEDIQTGHTELDQRAVITGADEESITRLLTSPPVLEALLHLFSLDGKWMITDRGALITVSVKALRDGGASKVIDALVDVVSAMGAAREG